MKTCMFSLVFIISLFCFSSFSFSGPEKKHEFTGANKCKMCHKAEYVQWQKTAHANAFKTLASPEAAKYSKDAQKDVACLKCHVTGFGEAGKIVAEDGVQCESCHGAGKDYSTNKIMKDKKLAAGNGLVIPSEDRCKECHNKQSPTFKEFDFKVFHAKVMHKEVK